MKLGIAAALALASVSMTGASALQAQDDAAAAQQMMNDPNPATFQVYGVTPAPRSVRDPSVQGERALPVATPGGGTPYLVGVNVPLTKPVKAGDKLQMLFYAKLVKPDAGESAAKIGAQVQLLGAPYTPVFAQSVDVPTTWKLFQLEGKADKDYAKGSLGATFHVNSAKHTVAFGIVAVFDKGQ